MTWTFAQRCARARSGTTVTLEPGSYDSSEPIVIENKRLQIQGPRSAVVHAEFTMYNSYVRFDGFTMEMNKVGAPQRTGIVWPYAQNGMVTVVGGQFWSDDVLWKSWRPANWPELGWPPQFDKCAIHAGGGAFVRVMARTMSSPIDWRGNDAQVIELYYGGVLYLFGSDQFPLGIQPGTQPFKGAAIAIVNADLVMSGCHIYDNGNSPYGVSAARNSYVQVGAGVYTTIQKSIPVIVDSTSWKWVAPGSIG